MAQPVLLGTSCLEHRGPVIAHQDWTGVKVKIIGAFCRGASWEPTVAPDSPAQPSKGHSQDFTAMIHANLHQIAIMIHLMLGVHLTPMMPAGRPLQYVRRASQMCANVCIRGNCCRRRSTQPLRTFQTSLPWHCMGQVAQHGIKLQGRQLPADVLQDQIFPVRTTTGASCLGVLSAVNVLQRFQAMFSTAQICSTATMFAAMPPIVTMISLETRAVPLIRQRVFPSRCTKLKDVNASIMAMN